MGYIEDTRKVLQNFLAPELRAIVVRLDKLEEIVNGNERRADQRSSDIEQRADQRFSEMMQQIAEAEARGQQRLAELEHHTDQRFFEYERRAEQRHLETLNAISTLSNFQAVLERLARLESKQNISAA